ncbi:hypothetical protein V7S43_016616 [Phytophthora oleae]|uniref:PiggyBac transposable element-derived protein domain-containing protein n=1 Tax=Phytophthora oleae TaxID=2107226 RepID=A0ABD3EWG0_9STRA
MKEACNRLYVRLQYIFAELGKVEKKKRLPSSEATWASLPSTCNIWNANKLVVRLIEHHAMMDGLFWKNENIDMLFKLLGLAGMEAMMAWKQKWGMDQRMHQEALKN